MLLFWLLNRLVIVATLYYKISQLLNITKKPKIMIITCLIILLYNKIVKNNGGYSPLLKRI
ncbi:hypothetical protein SAMN05443549_105107 [Flavobacterium fluvii]|uniref:Uncharacterized protein n=1 Tax=Flavobacterium fluvii TaxID=468056 RepID=A0A1M5L924_9FLAO|nr:hypothetical protein SAMN05443549_105107 [Flavobacterium fluvii]